MKRRLGADVPTPVEQRPPLQPSVYPNAYSVDRLASYREYWSAELTKAAKPQDFTPKIGLDATKPLTGLVNECRLTVLYGRSGPSISPPPPYPFRDEVWTADGEVRKLYDGFGVIVGKGVTGKFWAPATAQAYWAATYNRGRTLFDELITSMRAFEAAQSKGPPITDLWSLAVWGVFVYVVAVDQRHSGPR